MFGEPYCKINTVFKRDDRGVIVPGEFSCPEFEYLADRPWILTEKCDGTNIRLFWDGERVTVGGRTDNAQVPARLTAALAPQLDPEVWRRAFDQGASDVTVYGEGYGPGIQKGGNYRDDAPTVIVFDVRVGRWWLGREDVADVATKLGLGVVPVVANCSLRRAVDWIYDVARGTSRFPSVVAETNGKEFLGTEGVVGRPAVDLFDRRGDRVIAKIKVKDFVAYEKRRAGEGVSVPLPRATPS